MSYRNHSNSREHQRLLKLAREYSQKGYQVTLYPEQTRLPAPLTCCPPTLIAEREDQAIAVEVRTHQNLTLNGDRDLRLMAKQVQQLPGWEFELVVTNPRDRA
jgi:hypothetical protein